MRLILTATTLAAVVFLSAASHAAGQEPNACADPPAAANGTSAFEKFCARCHDASRLSKSYFRGADAKEASRRQGQLAAFLDRHSACPHVHHEAIAAWLKELWARQ